MADFNIDYSVVIPVLNEERSIQIMTDSLHKVLTPITQYYEIIFVDDGSSDGTYDKIEHLSLEDERIQGISFSRNFGHQNAILAGITYASGRAVITMDGDMQHPPEVIPLLIEKYNQGYDVVNTIRKDHENISFSKSFTSRCYYFLFNLLIRRGTVKPGSADFRLLNYRAAQVFLSLKEKDRFTRGLISWMGFKQVEVTYHSNRRLYGKTKYSFRKMLKLALDGITSFSSRPLYLSLYLGLLVSIGAFIYAFYVLVVYAMGNTVQGWTSILLVTLFLGGILLINLGIIGIYLARVYNELKDRPHYVVEKFTKKLGKDKRIND